MPYFGKTSRDRLATCHPFLVRVATEVIKVYDFCIPCGGRTQEEQDALYASGRTVDGPIVTWTRDSKHVRTPSEAFDFCPWTPGIGPDWDNIEMFYKIGYAMLYVAGQWEFDVTWGKEWSTPDLPHIQLNLN